MHKIYIQIQASSVMWLEGIQYYQTQGFSSNLRYLNTLHKSSSFKDFDWIFSKGLMAVILFDPMIDY